MLDHFLDIWLRSVLPRLPWVTVLTVPMLDRCSINQGVISCLQLPADPSEILYRSWSRPSFFIWCWITWYCIELFILIYALPSCARHLCIGWRCGAKMQRCLWGRHVECCWYPAHALGDQQSNQQGEFKIHNNRSSTSDSSLIHSD